MLCDSVTLCVRTQARLCLSEKMDLCFHFSHHTHRSRPRKDSIPGGTMYAAQLLSYREGQVPFASARPRSSDSTPFSSLTVQPKHHLFRASCPNLQTQVAALPTTPQRPVPTSKSPPLPWWSVTGRPALCISKGTHHTAFISVLKPHTPRAPSSYWKIV